MNGADLCGKTGGLPPVYTMGTISITGPATLTGSGPSVQNGSLNIPLAQYVTALAPTANTVLTTSVSSATYGSSSNYVTVYANPGSAGITLNAVTGYGTLVVNGNLTMGGNFSWNGLVIATGAITFSGGGSAININGTALSDGSVNLSGHINSDYNSCTVSQALATQPLQVKRWKQL